MDEFLSYLRQVYNLANGYDSSRASKLTLGVAGLPEVQRLPVAHDLQRRGRRNHATTAKCLLLKGAGDLGGWCGDLITFYGEWVRDEPANKNGYQYAMSRIAKTNVITTFMLNDLVEDIDRHHIGMMIRGGANVATQFEYVLPAAAT
ncbi:hypothetical protein [Actinophytocola gossypii]|uniref:Uncharacterized protein n=1 Tax=Actinophytocola gossypii TaxID=2812003 RepID=A0ABT2J3M0_9PSEU|nr:hypothetical protein [Actinophytocola gossypii]MCT2582457.1 hypothetical protein [Actinophytocola gossypii]